MDIIDTLKLDTANYTANMAKATQSGVAGMQKVQAETAKATAAIKTQSGVLGSLKGVFAGLLTVSAVKGAINLAESFDKVSGTIKNATSDLTEFNAFQKSTFETAQKLGLPFDKVASSVTALIPPMKAVGANTKQIQTFAETLQAGFKANAFSGGDAVITAIAKSFNKGTIDARAFQQALIGIPDLAANIAKHLGMTEQEVKALGVAGKLTTNQFVKAVNAANPEYLAQAKNINSLSDSFNYLKNALSQYLSGANQASGFTKALAAAVKFAADNIDKLAIGFTVIAGLKIASMMTSILAPVVALGGAVVKNTVAWAAETAAITANTRAKMANAIAAGAGVKSNQLSAGMNAIANGTGLLVGGFGGVKNALSGILKFLGKGGILAAVAAVIALTGQWQNTVDSVKYIFNDLKGVASTLWDSAKAGIAAMTDGIKNFIGQSEFLSGFFSQFDSGIFGVFEMIGKAADAVVSGLKTAFAALIQNTVASVKVVLNALTMPIRGVLTAIEKGFNKVFSIYNKVADTIGLKPIDLNIDFSEIKDKLTFDADFMGIDELKDLFNTYQSEQKQSGLEAYFRQMKSDIDASRQIAAAANDERQKEVDNLGSLNNNLSDFNAALADKVKDTKAQKLGGKSATELQIEIDKLYNDTDFSKRDDDFYKKIDDLQNAILQSNQSIDWDKVAQAVAGVQVSSRMDLSTPVETGQAAEKTEALTAVNERQITALQENTAAINAMQTKTQTPEPPPITIKLIGNIDNMKEFIQVQIGDYLGKAAIVAG